MKTLTSRVAVSPKEDWLDNCVFKARHETLSRDTATLIQKFEKTALPEPAQRITSPLIDSDFETSTQPSASRGGHRPPLQVQSPPATRMANPSLPAKKTRPVPNTTLAAELHSFRQLSAPLFCPETSMDTLPEYILFGLIVLLAAAWPILAMLGVMARR